MLLAAGFTFSSLASLLLVGLVTATLMMRLHIARRKQLSQAVASPLKAATSSYELDSPESMRRQVEIYDLTREAQARLDNKIAMLQQLLVEADERIARLSELESQRLHVGPHRDIEGGAVGEGTSDADPYARDTARYAVVFGMADAGHNPMSIARRLSLPLGEVELMLSLRRRLPQRPAA